VRRARAARYPRSVREWSRQTSETLFRHRLFELRRETHGNPEDSDTREALILDAPAWVNVVPVLDDGRVLLVRQWRFGLGGPTLEIPGGMVDPGEDPAAAAARELLEETGYRAGEIALLGAVDPNPAFLANRCWSFRASRLERVGAPTGDGWEEIEVSSVRGDRLPELVAAGEIRHALVLAALYLYDLDRRP
jgi:ADP-ribose pyrophosphatase